MIFLPEPPLGSPSTACSFCGGSSWNKRKVEIREQTQMSGSIYVMEEIISEEEITTWECANRDCRRMVQTERNVGWRTK